MAKTVRLDEDVYERIRDAKRPDETYSEAIERLIGGRSFTELAGILSDEDAAEYRRVIEEANEDSGQEMR